MYKKKLKEINMINSPLENDQSKNQPIKKVNIINNQKLQENFKRRNLPELKLSKLKSKIPLETDNDIKEDNSLKLKPLNIIRKPKSKSQMKNREIVFPKIKNVFPNNAENKRNFPLIPNNNFSNHNYNFVYNNVNNTQPIPNPNNINNPINAFKIKNTYPIRPKTIPQKKFNKIKKENENNNNHHINTFSNLHKPINQNLNNINLTFGYLNNQKNQNFKNQRTINKNISNNNNKNNKNTNSNSFQNLQTLVNQNYPIENNIIASSERIPEMDMILEGINIPLNKPKSVTVSPDILNQCFPGFEESKYSHLNEFSNNDFIKGYAYNSNKGNIRDYNEDTITVTKININNININNDLIDGGDNNDNFYFFAIYDGHGGNGCSLFLQNNLHKYLTDFSKESLKFSIEKSEKTFCENYALDSKKNEIKDMSGSCGTMLLLKKNKIIIGNVGDSRITIFKKSKEYFSTRDHKPNLEEEKNRIISNGGKIYQTPSFFPLYQNGKEIEIPWRVFPGRLSVSRTFGDIEAKEEKFGGMKNVVSSSPDLFEIDFDNNISFIIIGCDGIFDVLTNNDLVQCVKIILTNNKNQKNINLICKECCDFIIKCSLALDSFDNVSCIFIAGNLDKIWED